MKKKVQRLKRILSSMLCVILMLSCLPQNVMVVYAEETQSSVTRDVSTEEEFMEALADTSVSIINLTNSITLTRSQDGNDNVFVIPRAVTIQGGQLILERAGIILGADVAFSHISICFSNAVRNAVIANGYNLTLDTVTSGDSKFNIDVFCGGITDYTGGNWQEIPSAGMRANVTIKGENNFGTDDSGIKGGTIFAGSLSDVGYQSEDIANTYEGNVNITIEKGASGFGEIYGCGARENRDGGFANKWKISADCYKVNGEVIVSLKECASVTVHGETGGEKNTTFVYMDDGSGYPCHATLEHISSVLLYPSEDGSKAILNPTIMGAGEKDFEMISVPANTRLSFTNMTDKITTAKFYGGGELVFKEETQTLYITDEVKGMTKVAVGDVSFDNANSMGTIYSEQTYIVVDKENDDYGFILLPNTNNSNMMIANDGDGNWITQQAESSVVIRSITGFSDVEVKAGSDADLMLPIEVEFVNEDETQFISDVPMVVSINGKEISTVQGTFGYDYIAGDEDEALCMWFDSNEELYITRVNPEVGFEAGRYKISMVIPAEYMENSKDYRMEFVLTVICDKHSGGVANCKKQAECQVCGVAYGELDGTNHSGEVELRGVKEATEIETGYTGDTYCLSCNTKILDGKVIPKLPEKEKPKVSIADASVTLFGEEYGGIEDLPEVTVTMGEKILTENVDYTVTYESNAILRNIKVIITGIGNYTGKKEAFYDIKSTNIEDATVVLSETEYVFDGTAKEPEVTVTLEGKILTKDVDYVVDYEFNVYVGGGEVFVTGIGHYSGWQSVYFKIISPESGTCGENLTWKVKDGTLTISGTGEMERYGEIKTAPWSSAYISKIIVGDGVTNIANCAFSYNPNLTSVSIGKNVTSIGWSSFMECRNLKNIVIPAKVKTIEAAAFSDCVNLTNITIPTSVTKIGDNAFWRCTNLTSITIPANVTTVGMFAFGECKNLTIYCYKDSAAHKYAVDNKVAYKLLQSIVDIADVTVKLSQISYIYNGEAKKPDVTVTLNGKALKKDTDFTVSYKDNTRIGTATVTITGKGNYSGKKSVNFEIKPISLTNATVKLSKVSYTYDGKAKKPSITVTLDGKTLKKDTDYTVSYKNNTKAGTATVTITGKGNYSGSLKKTYTIKVKSIKDAKVKLSTTSYTYNGKAKKPSITLTLDDKKLKKDTDYTVSYKNNKNIGKATVTIKGKGNYSGEITKTFTISAKKGTAVTVGNLKYKITDASKKTVSVTGVKSSQKTITIPDKITYGGASFKVTAIEKATFEKNKKVTKVVVGKNVEQIGKNAFSGCSKLKTIEIKSTKLKKVEKNAFKGIHAKASIKVPKKQFADYKKLLNGKGQGSKVKIVK